jgi:hypothetical protein
MNWKECGRKRSWPNLRYYSNICLEGLRKTIKPVITSCVLAEIQTRHLLNTCHNMCYYFRQLVCFLGLLLPWKLQQYVPKHWWTSTVLHGITPQKKILLIVITTRTSNLKPVWVFSNFSTNLILTLTSYYSILEKHYTNKTLTANHKTSRIKTFSQRTAESCYHMIQNTSTHCAASCCIKPLLVFIRFWM